MTDQLSDSSLFQELKGWQGLIGSIFGFTALIAGALFNYHLNRKRDSMVRREEASAIAAALFGEIVLLRTEVALIARSIAAAYVRRGTQRVGTTDFDKHFLERCKLPEPILYKALAP
jgi:hypothetical protein